MKTLRSPDPASAIWKRLQLTSPLSLPAARSLLKLQFSSEDQKRMKQLSGKARTGTLSALEEDEIEAYERLTSLLDVIHAHARMILNKSKSAS